MNTAEHSSWKEGQAEWWHFKQKHSQFVQRSLKSFKYIGDNCKVSSLSVKIIEVSVP